MQKLFNADLLDLFPVEDGWVKSEYGTVEDPVLIEWNINGVATVDHGEYWNDGINMGSRNNKATTVNGNAILTVDSIPLTNASLHSLRRLRRLSFFLLKPIVGNAVSRIKEYEPLLTIS